MRRATWDNFKHFMGEVISIHALREEGDKAGEAAKDTAGISIHALREEGDEQVYFRRLCDSQFLSTPSVRRATGGTAPGDRWGLYFYPRPP